MEIFFRAGEFSARNDGFARFIMYNCFVGDDAGEIRLGVDVRSTPGPGELMKNCKTLTGSAI
jgi:hypothetical protein